MAAHAFHWVRGPGSGVGPTGRGAGGRGGSEMTGDLPGRGSEPGRRGLIGIVASDWSSARWAGPPQHPAPPSSNRKCLSVFPAGCHFTRLGPEEKDSAAAAGPGHRRRWRRRRRRRRQRQRRTAKEDEEEEAKQKKSQAESTTTTAGTAGPGESGGGGGGGGPATVRRDKSLLNYSFQAV